MRPARFVRRRMQNKPKNRLVAVDFDGTLVAHRWPKIGEELPLAVTTLRELIYEEKCDIVLWTSRTGADLDAAIAWCDRRFPLFAINRNPYSVTKSKPFFTLTIDDTAVGTPLTEEGWVDWVLLRPIIRKRLRG